MRCAVVGHVEWTEFARVPRVPAAGEIVHATDTLAEPAGGGSVVARQLALLAGGCDFFTALGDDELGRRAAGRLEELGVAVHARIEGRSRRAWVHVDDAGERTITVLGDKLLARGPLALDGYDAVFFVSGDAAALRSARAARFLGATPRELGTLKEAAVPLDLLVGSATDPGERYDGSLEVRTLVRTAGADGGVANGRPYPAAPLEGPLADTYGAGDSFGAALCFALARGDSLEDALALAGRAGAAVLGGRGPYASQLALVA
ncbi:MAG TPA: PfkB family carbohydrate kinase [Gaiellaceae bacterium]